MIAGFIITFREILEAALIVGIILSYLVRTHQTQYKKTVLWGTLSGIGASILGAFLFSKFAGGFSGRTEEIFEGITMLVGAALLTTMILWMMKQKHIAQELEQKVASELQADTRGLGLFLLVFVAILREGIETVIFLSSASFSAGDSTIIGAIAGIIFAIAVGYALFIGALNINLKRFFNLTSILLILFAAGLVAHGVHELQEAGVIPIIIEHVWDINPPINPDGTYPPLHEKGVIGELLKGLFGYNGNPSLLEVLSYLGYLTLVLLLWRKEERGHRKQYSKVAYQS